MICGGPAMKPADGRADIRVGVLPVGNVPDIATKVVAAQFVGMWNIHADVLQSLEHPQYAFDQRRIQYNAGAIITDLESSGDTPAFADYHKIIGILDLDLFVPVFTHVLGEARLGGKFALVSLFRLDRNLERAAKIALHEFGHLCGLEHCENDGCLMKFSKGIRELDTLRLRFCRHCSASFQNAFAFGRLPAE